MKIALCTTTIHVPHALKLMRKCSDDVRFFVAIDKNTATDAELFCTYDTTNIAVLLVSSDNWKCSEAIGWNTLARRNIAFLEALKWGADLIYSWDNDNLPVSTDHFNRLEDIFAEPFNGLMAVAGADRWFDPGELLIPRTRHRGHPYDIIAYAIKTTVEDARLGVAAGLVLGDPDVDAVTRMEKKPDVQQVSELARSGVAVHPYSWTVFNSQNTAVIRELVPGWFMMPGVGRHDDIYASLVVQRVARERNLHVHFGQPFTYQQRNPHDLLKDLRAEIDGMENIETFAGLLDALILPGKSVIDDVRIIYEQLAYCPFIPAQAAKAALLYLEDCEGVLK